MLEFEAITIFPQSSFCPWCLLMKWAVSLGATTAAIRTFTMDKKRGKKPEETNENHIPRGDNRSVYRSFTWWFLLLCNKIWSNIEDCTLHKDTVYWTVTVFLSQQMLCTRLCKKKNKIISTTRKIKNKKKIWIFCKRNCIILA